MKKFKKGLKSLLGGVIVGMTAIVVYKAGETILDNYFDKDL